MRKIIESTLVAADGVIGSPPLWALDYRDEEVTRDALERLSGSDAMLMGRGTYELFAAIWPGQTDDFAQRMNGIRKYVFSSTLAGADWSNSTIVRGDVLSEVTKIKEQDGGDLALFGHGRLAQMLLENGLIDELRLSTVQELGRLDILVNNAGVFIGGPIEDATVGQADRLWAVDVRAVFVASQAAARHMGEGGRIITIGSALADRVPAPGMTLYAMAKSALTGLTKGLSRDLGPRGITVALVHGGLIDTDMNPADSPAASFLGSIPALGRYGSADDIAALVTHLAGDGGRYVSGAAISVDGGFAA